MNVKKFSQYHLNENVDTGKFSIEKAKKYVKFFTKIKYLFIDVDIKLSFQEIFDFIRTGDKSSINPSLYNDISIILEDNKQEIQSAYDEVFATNEICLSSLLISVLFALSFYYAFSRGWFDKLFSKIDTFVKGGKSTCCKPTYKPPIRKENTPTPTSKKNRVDELLDKVNRRGVNSLTTDEKEYLRKNN